MSGWFHRNALKSTSKQSFNLAMVAAQPEAVELCTKLKTNRLKLLEYLARPDSQEDVVTLTFSEYLSLLMGFIVNCGDGGSGMDSSKLRHTLKFSWTNSMLGSSSATTQQDSLFELISICQEFGIWLMKRAVVLASRADLTVDAAKEIHLSLRRAAGIFAAMQSEYVDRLLEKQPTTGSDLDTRVANAYIMQCIGEAQEVTVARAIELKHSPTIIAPLARETGGVFLSAASAIKTLEPKRFAKWCLYFQYKSEFYESLAWAHFGDHLLKEEKCGEAVRALEEAEKHYKSAQIHLKEYNKQKTYGPSVPRPEEHPFYRRAGPHIKRIKEKCLNENVMIYHHRVPLEIKFNLQATHGLVKPEPFHPPPANPLWSNNSIRAFDVSKYSPPKPVPAASQPKPTTTNGKGDDGNPIPKIEEDHSKSGATKNDCTIQ